MWTHVTASRRSSSSNFPRGTSVAMLLFSCIRYRRVVFFCSPLTQRMCDKHAYRHAQAHRRARIYIDAETYSGKC